MELIKSPFQNYCDYHVGIAGGSILKTKDEKYIAQTFSRPLYVLRVTL